MRRLVSRATPAAESGTTRGADATGPGPDAVRIVAAGIDNPYASVAAMLAPDRVEN